MCVCAAGRIGIYRSGPGLKSLRLPSSVDCSLSGLHFRLGGVHFDARCSRCFCARCQYTHLVTWICGFLHRQGQLLRCHLWNFRGCHRESRQLPLYVVSGHPIFLGRLWGQDPWCSLRDSALLWTSVHLRSSFGSSRGPMPDLFVDSTPESRLSAFRSW